MQRSTCSASSWCSRNARSSGNGPCQATRLRHPPCLLLAIEEQAFADPGFQARHPAAVRQGFARLADSHFAGPDIDASVEWQRDEDPLPAVYAIVRGLMQQQSARTGNLES